jgi:sugar phosphate isomerase/epimerase
VGRGAHDAAWWSSFIAALSRHTRAAVLSIEHEDRLVAPEDGVAESARLLGRTS